MLFEGFWATAFVAVFCEFGHRVFCAFEDLNTEIDRLDWYRFPIQCQKMLPIIIAGCQKASCIKGYGGIICIRKTLKEVNCNRKQQLHGLKENWCIVRRY